jgi:hypothetical protein
VFARKILPVMKSWLATAVSLLACGCSQTGTETKTTSPKALEPITGRQALQYTHGSARFWAPDAQPITVRSMNLDQVKPVDGKAGAWEINYVSAQMARARTYTWSAVEIGDSLPKGVFRGPEEAWQGPQGQQRPFVPEALRIDTPQALQTAVANSTDYLKKPYSKPQVTFLLESTPRFPNPVWRVLWGTSVGSAEHTVIVDAVTGALLAKN